MLCSDFSGFFLLNFARDVWSCGVVNGLHEMYGHIHMIYISQNFNFMVNLKSFVTMIVKYQWVLSSTFCFEIFSSRDQWKVFTKNKLNEYLISLFGTWSHIFVPPDTLVSVLLGTFYLDHHTILSTGRPLLFSIIVKILKLKCIEYYIHKS